jgi:hypothetical protein
LAVGMVNMAYNFVTPGNAALRFEAIRYLSRSEILSKGKVPVLN